MYHRKASVLPSQTPFLAVAVWVALVTQHDREQAGGGRWGRPSVLGMSVECHGHILPSAPTHATAVGPSPAAAPGQQLLQQPGKRIVGDDLHPLGPQSARHSLMHSPSPWFPLSSPQGSTRKETRTRSRGPFPPLTLLTPARSSPAPTEHRLICVVSAGTGKPVDYYAH